MAKFLFPAGSTFIETAPSPATTGTSLVVAAGTGVLAPATPFEAILLPNNANDANEAESVEVTNVSGDTLTIVRKEEGTKARTVVVGDRIIFGVTAPLTGSAGYEKRYSVLWEQEAQETELAEKSGATLAGFAGAALLNIEATNGGKVSTYINSADYPSGTTLRLSLLVITNAVAPAATMAIGLYPISAPKGASGKVEVKVGSKVASSEAKVETPAKEAINEAYSGAITMPSTGAFVVALSNTAKWAASSTASLRARLEVYC